MTVRANERILTKFDIRLIFEKNVQKIQVLLKSEKHNGYFTWRPSYIYNISLNSWQNKKCFRETCKENQSTFYVQ